MHESIEPGGGAEILFLDHIKLLKKKGLVVNSLTFNREKKQGHPDYMIKESNILLIRIFDKVLFNFRAYFKIKKIVRDFSPDLVHIFHNNLYPLPVLLAIPQNIPIIQSVNDYQLVCASVWGVYRDTGKECNCGFSLASVKNKCIPLYRYLIFFLKNKFSRALTKKRVALFLVSHSQLKRRMEKQGFSNIRIIPHFFQPLNRRGSLKESLRNNKILLFIGKLSMEKGCHILIDALKIVNNKIPDIKLIIVGDGPEKINLVNQVFLLGLQKKIDFRGILKRQQLPRLYIASLGLIVPSIWMENSGLVLIEAMYFGKPIIGSNIGGIPDLIKNNNNGLLFTPRSRIDLAKKILTLVMDEKKRKKMNKLSKQYYIKYSPEVYFDNLISFYKDVILNHG